MQFRYPKRGLSQLPCIRISTKTVSQNCTCVQTPVVNLGNPHYHGVTMHQENLKPARGPTDAMGQIGGRGYNPGSDLRSEASTAGRRPHGWAKHVWRTTTTRGLRSQVLHARARRSAWSYRLSTRRVRTRGQRCRGLSACTSIGPGRPSVTPQDLALGGMLYAQSSSHPLGGQVRSKLVYSRKACSCVRPERTNCRSL